MKIIKHELKDDRYTLHAQASAQNVNKAYELAQMSFAAQVGLKPEDGSSIEQAAREKLGIDDLDATIMPEIGEFLMPFVMDKFGVLPAIPPTVVVEGEAKRDNPVDLRVSFLKKPEFELTSYEPVEFTIVKTGVSDAQVEEQIEIIAKNAATFEATDATKVKDGDFVKIALTAKENGKEVESLCTEGRTYSIGKKLMPKSFDTALIGMKVGEEKSFTVDLAQDTPEGEKPARPLDCVVKILEVQKIVIPAINDEWLKENAPFYPNMDAMREDIKNRMLEQNEIDFANKQMDMAAKELAKRFEGKISDEIYEQMHTQLISNIRRQVQSQGMDFNEFVENQGGQQNFSMTLMVQARDMLREGYALEALFRNKKLVVSEKDTLAACREMSPGDPEWFHKQSVEAGRSWAIREASERMCASKYLINTARITIQEED